MDFGDFKEVGLIGSSRQPDVGSEEEKNRYPIAGDAVCRPALDLVGERSFQRSGMYLNFVSPNRSRTKNLMEG
ncbi:Serine/threonine-protein kinase SMG1 [Manis javanica]|nr:Serine/threonine-protein kinase SMG1 [Manis javanica]